MTPETGTPYDEFFTVACQAMRASSGSGALGVLGWWDILADLDDRDALSAVFAVFRAQGKELADSPALGGLLAQPFLEGTGLHAGSVVAATRRESTRRGPIWVIVGEIGERQVLFADPERGAFVIDPDDAGLRRVDVPGRYAVHEASVDLAGHTPAIGPGGFGAAAQRSAFLGRVAVAEEILGTAEQTVELAVDYAGAREQFGKPIGSFQAVRHLLAWAQTDCVAIDATIRKALLVLDDPPPRFDEVVKALAGRNGRRACERTLQVLGGIGFTAEHAHHHHHSRVLLLDSVLGTSADLTHGLGSWLRTSRSDPQFAATILAAS